MINHAPLSISEILQRIDESENQKELIQAYMQTGSFWPFLNWYYANDLGDIQDAVSYRLNTIDHGSIASHLTTLQGLRKFSKESQINILSRIMESLSASEVMMMEHVFTKTLEEYYPNIDWELFDPLVKRYGI